MMVDSVTTRGLLGVPSTGRKCGATVTKFIVTEAVTLESGMHPLSPGGGDATGVQVTLTLAAVRFAAVKISLILVRAAVLSKMGALGLVPSAGVTTPTRAPSRAALVAMLAVNQARLSSSPPRKMIRSVGRTTMNSSVDVPR